jgi:hypothetical protein
MKDIPQLLRSFEKEEDPGQIEQIAACNRIADGLTELGAGIGDLQKIYEDYYAVYTALAKDQQKLQNLQLHKLLTEGVSVLEKDISKDGYCPLCQQEKDKLRLIKELKGRIEMLDTLGKEFDKVKAGCQGLGTVLQNNTNAVGTLLKEKMLSEKDFRILKTSLEKIREQLAAYEQECKKDILSGEKLTPVAKLAIGGKDINAAVVFARDKAAGLAEGRKGSEKIQIHAKIIRALDAYKEYVDIRKRQEALSIVRNTFEALYSDFIKRQEESLQLFLDEFSDEINGYYELMNPGEKVDGIRLVPLKDKTDEDLQGITIQFRFFEETHNPPKYLLSESHIHGLGIAFFLASVKAFNRHNHFFLLDDVVSSFDAQHRERFIRMLISEFKDFQVLLLTHERDFFELAANIVKEQGWSVCSLAWSQERGTDILPWNGTA